MANGDKTINFTKGFQLIGSDAGDLPPARRTEFHDEGGKGLVRAQEAARHRSLWRHRLSPYESLDSSDNLCEVLK